MPTKATYKKVSKKVVPPSKKRKFPVFVVVRHTRAGDQRISIIDDKGEISRRKAMCEAESIAEKAADNYGIGSASVYTGTLTYSMEPIQP